MNYSRYIVLFFFAAFISLGVYSNAFCAEAEKKITVVSPSWDKYTHENGSGLYFELLQIIYEPYGFKVQSRIVPWARCKAMIQEGKADCMPAAYLTPDDDRWTYPNYPLDVDYTGVVFLPETIATWNGPATLSGHTIVWPRGYNFQNYIDIDFKWTEIDSEQQGWEMVQAGRVDFYMDILPEIYSYMDNNNIYSESLQVETVFFIKTYMRFGTGDRSKELREMYDKGIQQLLESGELEHLYKKWSAVFPEFAFKNIEQE